MFGEKPRGGSKWKAFTMNLPFRFEGDRNIAVLMFLLRLSGLNEVPPGARATRASDGWIK